MKKRKVISKLLQLSLLSVVLASCAPKNEGHIAIPLRTVNNITSENYTLPLTKDRLEAFMHGKRSFILYVMAPNCGACKKVSPRFTYYVKKTKVEMYELNTQSSEFTTYQDYFRTTLNLRVTPTLFLFQNGEIIEKIEGANTFSNNDDVINFFGERIKRTNFFIKDESSKLASNKRAVIYTYNFDDENLELLFNETFYPLIDSEGYRTYLEHNASLNNNFLISFTTNDVTFNFHEPIINSEEVITYLATYFT